MARFPFPRPKATRIRPRIPGEMNRLEKRWAEKLEEEQLLGLVACWWYESMKFRLADRTWYTPDFVVVLTDGTIEVHETKGRMEEDAAVKLKVFAELYPFPVKLIRWESKAKTWDVRDVLDRGL